MREIVVDTETTGLDPATGDRIVELGAVELVNHMPTGRTFHAYINPQRDVPQEAVEVHGLTAAFLADKPLFAGIAAEFAAFVGDARLVIHNAAFDMKFLNAELGWAGQPTVPWARAVDAESHTFLPSTGLQAIYLKEQKLDPKKETIAYCRIGERSSHTWFVLTYLLGFDKVRNYDGSWTEWGNVVRAPIEKP